MTLNPKHKALRDLLAYWRSKAAGRHMPARKDIDPNEIKGLLPHVGLVDVERSPFRFRYRLVGTEITKSYGIELTGHYLDEMDLDDYRRQIIEEYVQAVENAEPICSVHDYTRADGRHIRYERMLLPLSNDGSIVDMLIGGCIFDRAFAWS